MFKNYFIIAWRNITGDKFYLLNIAGLAIGLTVGSLFFSIIDELPSRPMSITSNYRLECILSSAGKMIFCSYPDTLGHLKDEYPEIEEYVRLARSGTLFLKIGNGISEDSIFFAG
jgi:hypothetical protein